MSGEINKAGDGLSDEDMVAQVNEQTPSEEKYKDVFERERDGVTTDTEVAKASADDLQGD